MEPQHTYDGVDFFFLLVLDEEMQKGERIHTCEEYGFVLVDRGWCTRHFEGLEGYYTITRVGRRELELFRVWLKERQRRKRG